jgi:hypothetical protein
MNCVTVEHKLMFLNIDGSHNPTLIYITTQRSVPTCFAKRRVVAKWQRRTAPLGDTLSRKLTIFYIFWGIFKGMSKSVHNGAFLQKWHVVEKKYKDRNVNFGEMTWKIIDACLCRKLGSGASKRMYTIAHSIKNGKSKCPSCRETRWK